MEDNNNKLEFLRTNAVPLLVTGSYGFFVFNSFKKLIDVWKDTNSFFSISDKFSIVLILLLISIFCLIFYYEVVAKVKESVIGNIITIMSIIAFGLLLYYSANFGGYVMISIGLLILLIKSIQLNIMCKKRNYSDRIRNFFYYYVRTYTIMTSISLLVLVPLDLGYGTEVLNSIFGSPKEMVEVTKINSILGMTQITSTEIVELKNQVNIIANKYYSTSNNFYRSIFIIALSMVVYLLYALINLFLYGKRKSDRGNRLEVIEELNVLNSDSTNTLNFSSNLIGQIKIIRPAICIISGAISSISYYFNTLNFNNASLLFVVVFMTTGFGFIINDIIDVNKDKLNHKQRALPSNIISIGQAKLMAIIFVFLSIICSLFISNFVILINIFTLSLLSVYSYINNQYGFIANLITAFCTSLLLIISMQSINNYQNIILAIAIFIYSLSREIIFDSQDIEADKAFGKSSIPIIFGIKSADYFAGILLLMSTIIFAFYSIKFSNYTFLLTVGLFGNIISWIAFYIHFNKQNKFIEKYQMLTRFSFILFIIGFFKI